LGSARKGCGGNCAGGSGAGSPAGGRSPQIAEREALPLSVGAKHLLTPPEGSADALADLAKALPPGTTDDPSDLLQVAPVQGLASVQDSLPITLPPLVRAHSPCRKFAADAHRTSEDSPRSAAFNGLEHFAGTLPSNPRCLTAALATVSISPAASGGRRAGTRARASARPRRGARARGRGPRSGRPGWPPPRRRAADRSGGAGARAGPPPP
jgi:hypothetical protein